MQWTNPWVLWWLKVFSFAKVQPCFSSFWVFCGRKLKKPDLRSGFTLTVAVTSVYWTIHLSTVIWKRKENRERLCFGVPKDKNTICIHRSTTLVTSLAYIKINYHIMNRSKMADSWSVSWLQNLPVSCQISNFLLK